MTRILPIDNWQSNLLHINNSLSYIVYIFTHNNHIIYIGKQGKRRRSRGRSMSRSRFTWGNRAHSPHYGKLLPPLRRSRNCTDYSQRLQRRRRHWTSCSGRWDSSQGRRRQRQQQHWHRSPAPQSPSPAWPDDAVAPVAVDSAASIWCCNERERERAH